MIFADIFFDPSDTTVEDKILRSLADAYDKLGAEKFIVQVATETLYGNPFPWGHPLLEFFRAHSCLIRLVPCVFIRNIATTKALAIGQLLLFLTAEKILSLDFITSEQVVHMSEPLRQALFSFLVDVDLSRALELDHDYVRRHFPNFIDAQQEHDALAPLILAAGADSSYMDVISSMLDQNPSSAQYLTKEILRLASDEDTEARRKLKSFLLSGLKASSLTIRQYMLAILEFTTISELLYQNLGITYCRSIYLAMAKDPTEPAFIHAINRLRRRAVERHSSQSIGLAARALEDTLNAQSAKLILDVCKDVMQKDVVVFPSVVPPVKENWSPKSYAEWLLSSHYGQESAPYRPPTDLEAMAERLGLIIKEYPFPEEGFDACLVRSSVLCTPIIFMNCTKGPLGRQRFSIAHEIGHAVLPKHDSFCYVCTESDISEIIFNDDKVAEKEANQFASELLLPTRWFLEKVGQRNFIHDEISRIADEFMASRTAVAIKWTQLSNLQVAAVRTVDQRIEWVISSEEFPFAEKRNTIEPYTSAAFAIQAASRKKSHCTTSDLADWFLNLEGKVYIESRTLYENVTLTLMQLGEDYGSM